MATKKRTEGEGVTKKAGATKAPRAAGTRTAAPKAAAPRSKRAVRASAEGPPARPARPRIRASHSAPAEGAAPKKRVVAARPTGTSLALKAAGKPVAKKTPVGGPRRAAKRPPLDAPPEPSAAARELAVALAAAGIEKKAIGIEILNVAGKVDYADFIVVMTGRSDRHVHAIATGIDDAMRKRKVHALSIEGLSAATWVLLDFGDVVLHVFQEEARALYDIEGLWIDAGRVPVPADVPPEGAPSARSPSFDLDS